MSQDKKTTAIGYCCTGGDGVFSKTIAEIEIFNGIG
jgi:hypothetical protein